LSQHRRRNDRQVLEPGAPPCSPGPCQEKNITPN
jgi:hypothetical protein